MTSTSMPLISPSARNGCASQKSGAILKASVAAFYLCFLGNGALAVENLPLRLCADPDNLPFSSDRAENPGIYREIGRAIAQELNRPLTEVWYRTNFGKRATRVTLLAKQCDLSVGLPADSDFMGPALIFSRPFMKAGYALVLKKPATVSSWADLNGKAVAVQQNSTPQNVLATKDNITMVTELNPEETVKAVATGAADAAFVWAPSAGYVNKTLYSDSFNIIPVDGLGMQWPVAVAFGKRDGALRDAVNGVLNRISAKVDDLKVKYGFPAGEPVTLAEGPAQAKEAMKASEEPSAAKSAPEPTKPAEKVAEAPESAQTGGAPADSAALASPQGAASDGDRVHEGREVFNGTCSHCHGPDAVQAERKIDLRLLHHRYKDRMEEIFFKTVTDGRPTKGMPAWKDVFSQEQFVSIFAFLKTVQTD